MTGTVDQLVWQTMSGMAHGAGWAPPALNEMEETDRLPNPKHLTVRLTTHVFWHAYRRPWTGSVRSELVETVVNEQAELLI
jgi:hypothetical protein